MGVPRSIRIAIVSAAIAGLAITGLGILAAPGSAAVGTPAAPVAAEGLATLELTPSSTQVGVGENLAFIAAVTNTTGTDLVGLRVAGEATDGVVSLLGARASSGVFDPAASTWFVDRVEPGGSATLEIFARAETTGTARLALLAAAEEPAGTLRATETSIVVVEGTGVGTPNRPGDTAAMLVTTGGALVAVAGLIYLNRRRRSDDAPLAAQVASDPE